MTALTALTISAHSRVRPIVAPISLAVLGCLVGAILWFVAVSVVYSIVVRGIVRRCESRSPLRPVLKHGPWSIATMRVEECSKLYIGVMKVKIVSYG